MSHHSVYMQISKHKANIGRSHTSSYSFNITFADELRGLDWDIRFQINMSGFTLSSQGKAYYSHGSQTIQYTTR